MTPPRRRAARSGFTLIEVMMALAILIVVVLSGIGAITIGFRMLEDARMSTLASQVLQSEIENLRLDNWDQLNALPVEENFTVDSSLLNASFNRFTCTRTITEPETDLKQVVVAVTWNSMNGRPHSRRYVTLIARDGLNDYYYRRF